MKPLENEFRFYLAHQNELLPEYSGTVSVIKDEKILGAYDSDYVALAETSKTETPGTFLLILCTPGSEAYTQHFHSRVAFA